MNLRSVLLWSCLFKHSSGARPHIDLAAINFAADDTEADSQEEVTCTVVVENDTPYAIKDLVLVHKYLGASKPTHSLLWDKLPAGATSTPKSVITEVGFTALRQDWWMLSWRFEKSASECTACSKEDGSCETWITDPDNAFGQFAMDPMSYVKLAVGVAKIVTAGTAIAADVALGGMVTDFVAGKLLSGQNTDGFKACGINEIDFQNSEAGRPLRIRISPHFDVGDLVLHGDMQGEITAIEDDGAISVRFPKLLFQAESAAYRPRQLMFAPRADGQPPHFDVQLQEFNEGVTASDPLASEVRWQCDIVGKAMPCSVASSEDDEGEEVPIAVIDRSGRDVKDLVVIHRFNGLSPAVHIIEWSNADGDGSAGIGRVRTKTGFGFRNDWWAIGWVDNEDDCLAHSTFQRDFIHSLIDNPEKPLLDEAWSVAKSALGADIYWNTAIGLAKYGSKHIEAEGSTSATLAARIFGVPLLKTLTAGTETKGFLKCNLSPLDVEMGEAGKPVQIVIEPDGVRILADGGSTDCFVENTQLRCLQTEACSERPACRS